jgi:UDP-2,3-diacylglucosamine hydrolase
MKIWKTIRLPEVNLSPGKKVYFASDFHLGVPDANSSLQREKKIVAWLDSIKGEAQILILLGDIFDFWFEYRDVAPKGYIRFLGKLAELKDQGTKIWVFTGNHDMWMFDYLEREIGIEIVRNPALWTCNGNVFYLAHGDGLGKGDLTYKLLKGLFAAKWAQTLFAFLHPRIGMTIARQSSKTSRQSSASLSLSQDVLLTTLDRQAVYAQFLHDQDSSTLVGDKVDYYVMGHFHNRVDMPIGSQARYINLGTWMSTSSYATFDGEVLSLDLFEG